MDDALIVSLYWQRDETAIRRTEDKYENYLTKIAYNILNDFEDSRESVNDTYLRAWNSMPTHRPAVLSTYLGKITRALAIDIYRKRNSKKRAGSAYALSLSELDECIPGGRDTAQPIELKELGKVISRFLRALPEEARTVFVRKYYFMDSIHEIAAGCRMSEAKTKSMLHRTRKKLKVFLTKEGFLDD